MQPSAPAPPSNITLSALLTRRAPARSFLSHPSLFLASFSSVAFSPFSFLAGHACYEGVQLRIPPVAVYRALCSFASPRAVSRSRAVRLRTVTRRCNLPLQLLPQTSPSPRFSPVGPPLAPSFLTLPSSLLPSAQLLSLPSAFLLSTRVLRASHGSYAPRTLNSRVLQCLFRHLFPSPSFPVPHCPSAPCFGGQCGSTSNSSDHTEEGAVIPPPIAPQL